MAARHRLDDINRRLDKVDIIDEKLQSIDLDSLNEISQLKDC